LLLEIYAEEFDMHVKAVLLDVGGVLLSNGWDRQLRKKAALEFSVDDAEMQKRHDMVFDAYERGSLSLDDYLQHTVFFQRRDFSMQQFKDYMFSQVSPHAEMMDFIESYKSQSNVKVLIFSNEGKELAIDRFRKFPFFARVVDNYLISSFLRMRKPDPRIYEIAMGIVQLPPQEILLIDDRPKNLAPAAALGMMVIHHTNPAITAKLLTTY
jgi:putative hydrolase of the HAD superfamily